MKKYILLILVLGILYAYVDTNYTNYIYTSDKGNNTGTKLSSSMFTASNSDPVTTIVSADVNGELKTASSTATLDTNILNVAGLIINSNNGHPSICTSSGKSCIYFSDNDISIEIKDGNNNTASIIKAEANGSTWATVSGKRTDISALASVNYVDNTFVKKDTEYNIYADPSYWGNPKNNYMGTVPDSNGISGVYANNKNSGYGIYKWKIG